MLIPFFILEFTSIYAGKWIYYGLENWGTRGDMWGLMLAALFCAITVGLYWLFCVPLGIDLKGPVKGIPFPEDKIWKIVAIVYFILVKPYVEEWFWRRYSYEIFWVGEINFWLV